MQLLTSVRRRVRFPARPVPGRVRVLVAVLFLGALIGGLLLGQALALFAYAWPICLPCIGIQ